MSRRSNDWWVSRSIAPGPQRAEVGQHDPEFVPPPIGFTAHFGDVQKRRADEEPVDMPELWDGDQA